MCKLIYERGGDRATKREGGVAEGERERERQIEGGREIG